MDSKMITFFFFFYTAVVFSSVASYNITAVLESYPSFSMFNGYLTRTEIATTINSHAPPVTVLAVDNANISTSLSGKAPNVLKRIMSAHVILDYFDAPTLQRLGNRSVTVATLFTSSGKSLNNQQGYINITGFGSGNVGFTSAALAQSSLVTSLVSQPYNFSLLQISNVILPSGIDINSGPVSSPVIPPAASPKTSPAVSPSRAPGASPSRAPYASPAEPPAPSPAGAIPAKPPAASPTRPPAASPSRPPAASPTRPPAASPTRPPAASPSAPSPRKMKSPAPAPSSAAPTPAEAAGNDKSSGATARGVRATLVAAATVSSNLFLVFMV